MRNLSPFSRQILFFSKGLSQLKSFKKLCQLSLVIQTTIERLFLKSLCQLLLFKQTAIKRFFLEPQKKLIDHQFKEQLRNLNLKINFKSFLNFDLPDGRWQSFCLERTQWLVLNLLQYFHLKQVSTILVEKCSVTSLEVQ